MGAFRGITQSQQSRDLQSLHLREGRFQLLRPEHPHIGGSKPQVRRLKHHLCGSNGGIDLSVVFSVGLPVPGHRRVIGHCHDYRGMEVGAHAGIRLLQRLRTLEYEDALGLEIVGGRRVAAAFQDEGQLLLLHGAIAVLAEGISFRRQLCKIHGNISFFVIPGF